MYTMIPFRAHRHMPRLFNDPWQGERFLRSFFDMSDLFATTPFRVDVREEEQAYLLEAELPGFAQDQIELTVENDCLTVTAQMNEEKKEEEKGKYLYCERRSGRFQRSFALEGVDQEQIAATYQDGVLRVTLPKLEPKEKMASRRVDIK